MCCDQEFDNKADARLIALAPEMAELLQKWADVIEGQAGRDTTSMQMHGFSPVKLMGEIRDEARALLARARGES